MRSLHRKTCTVVNFDNYTRFRSIPNSVVSFLKVSLKEKPVRGKKKPARCFESSHD